ncbi:MAG: LamG-like jellyroll fold domain-containing protein [Actinocatenispora sp.]
MDTFSEVLIVKTREAADNPDLTTLRFGLQTVGVTVSLDERGRLSAVDGAGTPVFVAPTPLMWDSSDSSEAGVAEKASGPGLAQQAPLAASLDGDGLTLIPDPTMLSDPETVYPVFVDPSVSTSIDSWTYVDSAWPDESYMTSSGSGGRSDLPAGHYSDATGTGTQRSYVRFEFSSSIHNTRVTKAEFRAYSHEQWWNDPHDEPICSGSVTAPDQQTSWNNRPTVHQDMGCKDGHKGEWVGFDAETAMQEAADNGWGKLAFQLKSGDESDVHARQTFSISGSTQPVLAVTVDQQPNTPTGLKISPCYQACASPATTTSLQAKMTATVSDPDGGNLKHIDFEVWSADFSTRVAYTTTGITNVKSGSPASWTPNAPRANNKQYHWRVRACDPWWCGAWSQDRPSSGGDPDKWFTFTTDTSNETIPTVVCKPTDSSDPTSCVYPETEPGQAEVYGGGVGVPGTFTFGYSGTDQVEEFRWSLVNDDLTNVVPTTSSTLDVDIAPSASGAQTLYVQTVDGAGNRSEVRAYRLAVTAVPSDAGNWPMDEGQGTVAADTRTAQPGLPAPVLHDLTTSGATTWPEGHVGPYAIGLDGSTGSLATDVSVLDTTKSFTISAWAYLDADPGFQTVVSQEGVHSSSFYLQYRPEAAECHGCWAFVMRDHDTDADAVSGAWPDPSSPPANLRAPSFGEWTHLAGVVSVNADGSRQLLLYVDGELQATTTLSADLTFGSAGPLRVGRALSRSVPADFWSGQIDGVSVYQRALDSWDIGNLANPAELANPAGSDS